MNKEDLTAIIVVPVSTAIGAMLALTGSMHGHTIDRVPLMAACVAAIFGLQWIAFVPAYVFRTEKFYDITGSVTYIGAIVAALAITPVIDARSVLIAAFICIWAARLGFFLFLRILRAGEDSRFANVRGRFFRFLMAWTLQGLWVTFSLAAGLAAITSMHKLPIDALAIAGACLWVSGFAVEAIADAQKNAFRKQAANKGKFISTGLWSWSRHPNYFGEIILWTGIALIALPVLSGWQYVTLASPFMVTLLLTRVSGIPLLEEAADKKWGGQPEYEAYKKTTSLLVLLPPRRG